MNEALVLRLDGWYLGCALVFGVELAKRADTATGSGGTARKTVLIIGSVEIK